MDPNATNNTPEQQHYQWEDHGKGSDVWVCMEPFKLTLEQINFEHQIALPSVVQSFGNDDVDSFSNVVHYDLDFISSSSDTSTSDSLRSHPSTFLEPRGIPDTVRKKPADQRLSCTTESNPCDTRVHYVWTEKKLNPVGDEHLVNPYIIFNESQSDHLGYETVGLTNPSTSANDISTLIKISANTKSVSSQLNDKEKRQKFKIPFRKMATTEIPPSPLEPPSTTSEPLDTFNYVHLNTFETVAEALHLQWSVIGNKNLTPAPPEVVAQIVAQAEKKLKAGNLKRSNLIETSTSKTNPSGLPGTTQETLSLKSDAKTTCDTPIPLDCLYSYPLPPSLPADITDNVIHGNQVNTSGDSAQDTAKSTETAQGKILIPAQNITLTTEKRSWFEPSPISKKSADSKENEKVKSKKKEKLKNIATPKNCVLETVPSMAVTNCSSISSIVSSPFDQLPEEASLNKKTSENGKSDETDSIKSTSFHLSDCDPDEDYNYEDDTDAEAFLNSLPPIKAIELETFLKRLQNGRHSPPVKERSFKPRGTGIDSDGFFKMASVSVASHGCNYSPPTKDISDNRSLTSNNVELPEKDTSPSTLPQSLPIMTKPKIILPDPGPLFKNAMKPFTERKSKVNADSNFPVISKTNELNVTEILREKAKLEGQLEVLGSEAQTALQERAELQAQVASLQQKLLSSKNSESDVKQYALKADIASLKDSRVYLEHCLADTQKLLEEKIEDAKRLEEELKVAQELHDKQHIKIREIKDDLRARDVTIQALKNKVAELYVEVQTTLQNKMLSDTEARTAKSDLATIVSTKQWYHEQLQIANKMRSELQKELTTLHAQVSSRGTITERLKADNARLHQQLAETRQKAVLEKEMLARQLENIQVDILERETAFQEIQRERRIIEETFDSKIQSVEEEKTRLSILMQTTTELEAQLEKAQNNVKKKQVQIFTLETEQASMMKSLTVTEGKLTEKDKVIEELEQKLIEVESSLKAFQVELSEKNQEILKLKEEKATAEISLASAHEEKKIFDSALETLRGDLSKVEKSFWQMKQELYNRVSELDQVKKDKIQIKLELEQKVQEFSQLPQNVLFDQKNIEENEAIAKNFRKVQERNEILTKDLSDLRAELTQLKDKYIHEVHEKEALENLVGSVQENLNLVNCELEEERGKKIEEKQVDEDMDSNVSKLATENKDLKAKMKSLEKKAQTNLTKQKARAAKLAVDIESVKNELVDRQQTYDTNMELLSNKLREVVTGKEALQNEVDMLKRKFDLSMLQQQDQMKVELQTLAGDLESVQSQKYHLESQLIELEQATNQQIEQYVAQVVAMGQQLQQLIDEKDDAAREANVQKYQLSLELEKERGRLTGLQQSNTALKKHVSELEEALARRESALVEMQTHFSQNIKDQENNDCDYIKRIQELEETLSQEKSNQRDLRKQIGTKITENKRLKRQQKHLSLEHEQQGLDLEQKTSQYLAVADELQTLKNEMNCLHSQIQSVNHDNQTLHTEIERLQRNISDNQDRSPVIQEQLQSFHWQLQQKQCECEAAQGQLTLSEERHQLEQERLRKTQQNNIQEMENLRSELSASRQEKMNHQAKVTELRSALKTSIHQHKISKKVSSKTKSPLNKSSEAVIVKTGTEPIDPEPTLDVAKSPCSHDVGTQMYDEDIRESVFGPIAEPFNIEALEQLLQDTTVQALESKPLDDLQSCLVCLRAQISGLQEQIDVHSAAIHNSGETWRDVESQVVELQQVVQTVASGTASCETLTTAIAAQSNINSTTNIIDI